ncbi:MAG: hypothetical protein KJO07_24640 [Deltaproteobacteria bacterium]|nr:hypothetical protein [Deltaproteobacteria bacterium]
MKVYKLPFALVAMAWLALGCGKDLMKVHKDKDGDFDFGRTELLEAVDKVSKDRKNPVAVAELAATIDSLRPKFNESVDDEAERKLVFLAIGPLEKHFTDPIEEQLEVLGLTVWPIALRVEPEKGESPRQYAARVCSGPLALECKNAVPEYWPVILSSVVWRRMKERAREAYVGCGPCKSEPGQSHEKVLERYRAYQTEIGAKAAKARRRAKPGRWPRAGERARDWDAQWPLLDLVGNGSAEFRGKAIDNGAWRQLIREGRGDSEVLGLHIRPTSDVRTLRSILDDARKAGYSFVELQVRTDKFPYPPKTYRLAAKRVRGSKRIKVKPVDSVQILVQALDIHAKDAEVFSI